MKITQAFLGEHGVLYALFGHLETQLPEAKELDQIKQSGALLQTGLASHAGLEELLLFRALEPVIGEGGPLAVMRGEHEQIEAALEQLPAVGDLEQGKQLLAGIVRTARQHFAKEEQMLFPLATQALEENELHRLGSQWAEQRTVSLL